MNLKLWLVFISLSIFASASSAKDIYRDCLSQEEVRQLVQPFPSLGYLAEKAHCPDKSVESQLILGLKVLKNVKFSKNVEPTVDGAFSGKKYVDWWGYVTTYAKDIKIVDDCSERVVAYALYPGDTISFCSATDYYRPIYVAETLIHETNHLEKKTGHVECKQGDRPSQTACDADLNGDGAYTASIESLLMYGRYAMNVDPETRGYAFMEANRLAKNRFNYVKRYDIVDAYFVLTKDRTVHLAQYVKGDLLSKPIGTAPGLGFFLPELEWTSFVPTDSSLAPVILYNNGSFERNDKMPEYAQLHPFKKLGDKTNKDEDKNLIAGIWRGEHRFSLFKDHIRAICDIDKGYMTGRFPGYTARAFVYPEGIKLNADKVHVLMTSGEILVAGCKDNDLYLEWPNMRVDAKTIRMYRFNDRDTKSFITLQSNGKLQLRQGGKTHSLPTPMDGDIVDIIPMRYFNQLEFPMSEDELGELTTDDVELETEAQPESKSISEPEPAPVKTDKPKTLIKLPKPNRP